MALKLVEAISSQDKNAVPVDLEAGRASGQMTSYMPAVASSEHIRAAEMKSHLVKGVLKQRHFRSSSVFTSVWHLSSNVEMSPMTYFACDGADSEVVLEL